MSEKNEVKDVKEALILLKKNKAKIRAESEKMAFKVKVMTQNSANTKKDSKA